MATPQTVTPVTASDNTPVSILNPLRPVIVGGNAKLFRYSEALERADASIGDYVSTSDTTYYWPELPDGSLVDESYARLFVGTALLKYFEDLTTVAPVSSKPDRVRASATKFTSSAFRGVTHVRDAAFGSRDCAVGDIVEVSALDDSGDLQTLRTSIRGFVGETVSAAITSATVAGTGNAGAGTESIEALQTGLDNGLTLHIDPTSTYDGIEDGVLQETYTITVTTDSAGNDDLTYARLSVVSASGTDTVTGVAPAAVGVPFDIGTRGVKAYFTYLYDVSLSESSVQGSDLNDLIIGQSWVITAEQDFTPATATAAGTFSGTADTTYIARVTRGGYFASGLAPQIAITATNGTDSSGPSDVAALGSAITVGTKGVTVTFSGAGATGLRYGDEYYITAQAAGEGAMQTILLNNRLPAGIQDAVNLDLRLFTQQTGIVVSLQNPGVSGDFNYVTTADSFTVADNVYVEVTGFDDALELYEGDLYMEYRAWLPTATTALATITSDADLAAVPGESHPDNPVKWAATLAWANSNTLPVKYLAVADPDTLASWQTAVDRIEGEADVYGIVPLTDDQAVIDLFVTLVDDQSTEAAGKYCVVWDGQALADTEVLVDATTSSDDAVVTFTILEDADTTGTPAVLAYIESDNDTTAGLRAGDTLRFNYGTDAWGDVTYDSYVVDSVISTSSFRLVSGPTNEVTVPQKGEVWRSRTVADMALAQAARAEQYLNTRVRAVLPDTVGDGTYTFAGYFLAAALAGKRSSIAPNRSMTNLAIDGITVVDDIKQFNYGQLEAMEAAGVWLMNTNSAGDVTTRYAVTTAGVGDILTQEETVIANYDARHLLYQAAVADMKSQTNLTSDTMQMLSLKILGVMSQLKQVYNNLLGPQLIDGSVTSAVASVDSEDVVVINITETVPVPMNSVEIYSQIVA